MKYWHVLTVFLLQSVSTSAIPELSSKTVYDAVRGDIRDIEPFSSQAGQCKAEKIYLLLRHGSRNFGASITTRVEEFLDRFEVMVNSGSVTLNSKMEWYGNWSRGVYYKDYELVVEGMMEHYTIAKRYKEAFPDLFPVYSIPNYSLQTTSKMRTIQSGLSFMDGLLQDTGPLESSESRVNITMAGYMPPGLKITKNSDDQLLRFVDSCPKYEKYIDTLKWKEESKLFEATESFKSVIRSVSKSINFETNMEDTKALYYLCAEELMSPTQAHHSQFCNVFDSTAFDILDFSKDLEKYYKYSYPFDTTYKMSCLLLQDIIEQLETSENTPVLKFAHEETLLPLFSLMGMFDDGKILTHSTSDYLNRKMKISRIIPFAGNVAFIKQSCPGDSSPKIQVLVNEKEVVIPACSGRSCNHGNTCSYYCTLTQLKTIIDTHADGCDFNEICDVVEGKEYSSLHITIAALLTVSIIQTTYIFFHCMKRCPFGAKHPPQLQSDEQLLMESTEDANVSDRNLISTVLVGSSESGL